MISRYIYSQLYLKDVIYRKSALNLKVYAYIYTYQAPSNLKEEGLLMRTKPRTSS